MAFADALDRSYARLERQLMQVAEGMPAEKYCYRPSAEVRTFGEQLRHIGAVQWVVGAWIQDDKPPVDVGDGDSGPTSMTAKSEILNYVRGSFTYIRRGIKAFNEQNALDLISHPYDPTNTRLERVALVIGYACHGWDHYGQMVVYERLNGIVPPPSRSN